MATSNGGKGELYGKTRDTTEASSASANFLKLIASIRAAHARNNSLIVKGLKSKRD
jgi:hypothetical protein